MKKLLIIPLMILVLMFAFCSRKPEKIIGMKIYEYNKDFNNLIGKWKEMGINTVFMSRELAANENFRKLLDENDIEVYLIFPVFYDPEVLKSDSVLYAVTNMGQAAKDEWVEFVCPSRKLFREKKINEVADLVRDLHPDGVSIDFIRQFVYWEKIYPDRKAESINRACFCDSCIAGFCRETAVTVPENLLITSDKAEYILNNFEDKWTRYQCNNISSMADEISSKVNEISPGIKINIHIVPWRDDDFGGANLKVASQNLPELASHADYVSPMCYSQMLKRDALWISSVVAEMDTKAHGKILPSIQVGAEYIEDPFSAEDFGQCIDEALKGPSKGVVFFSWPLFERDSARMKTAAERIN